ncbi:DUF6493 family protein [Streptomyces sp. NPDC059456]|uniref:DUF6493 family protein n=1 Tax=Streptomyces sp. NPDC059456 TaxID=3346838 RepID=UPI0036A50B26
MNPILDAVREGRTGLLPGLLGPLTAPERQELLARLAHLRAEMRGWDWSRWRERDRIRSALLVAGAGCHTGASPAASWIGAHDLREGQEFPTEPLLGVLADRDPRWLGELAHRLAERTGTAEEDYPLIRELVRRAGCPVPTTDAFVHGWVRSIFTMDRARTTHNPLSIALRQDPYARELVPLLFATAESPEALHWCSDPTAPNHWPSELAALAQEGIVERRVLVDGCVARLRRGGRQNQLKFFLAMLTRLELTPAEERERTADWTALAAGAPSPLAGYAQQVLVRLVDAGGVPAQRLAEMSDVVLRRPEKKLVRAQLGLLGQALRRDPEARRTLLPAVAVAFGHEDTALQERALGLVVRYLPPGDRALRRELALRAEALSPLHRRAAAELLGPCTAPAPGSCAEPAYEEVLPPAPVRRRLARGPLTLAATVALVAASGAAGEPTAAAFESALDGLVRHAHHDRAALAGALRPALAGRRWHPEGDRPVDPRQLSGLDLMAAAVLGRVRAPDLVPGRGAHDGGCRPDCVHAALSAVTASRLTEAAHRILTDPQPFLLATPTWETGSLEPEELVVRLAAYRRLGAEPGPADFAQALLRVRRDPGAVPAAAALATAEGDRLAAWLAGAGEPPAVHRRVTDPFPDALAAPRSGPFADPFADPVPAVGPAAVPQAGPLRWDRPPRPPATRRIVLETAERCVVRREFPAAFRGLGRAHTERSRSCSPACAGGLVQGAVLPEDRETQAAWLLPEVTAGATARERGAGVPLPLPRLAELGGPAGPALHLTVATGLGARDAGDRRAAVDALLLLAARGELDAPRLGRDLAELLGLGTVKPSRLAGAARTAAATGAYATTWAVLAEALVPLLAGGGSARGTGELLAVAADCVERCGAYGPAPAGLAEGAGRPGASQRGRAAPRAVCYTPMSRPPQNCWLF